MLPPEQPKEPPKYEPPVSKPWITYGSEKEIDSEQTKNKRPLVCDIFQIDFFSFRIGYF